MQSMCKSCHGVAQIKDFYTQFDDFVMLYNEKFAKPGKEIEDMLKKEVWHHEGRRARMAAAMHAPDYTHWHGLYEVSRNFYHEFLPEVQELADHAGQGEKYKKIIQELLNKPENIWIKTGGSAETAKMIEEEQALRYKQ